LSSFKTQILNRLVLIPARKKYRRDFILSLSIGLTAIALGIEGIVIVILHDYLGVYISEPETLLAGSSIIAFLVLGLIALPFAYRYQIKALKWNESTENEQSPEVR
jgi:hypothetical protein